MWGDIHKSQRLGCEHLWVGREGHPFCLLWPWSAGWICLPVTHWPALTGPLSNLILLWNLPSLFLPELVLVQAASPALENLSPPPPPTHLPVLAETWLSQEACDHLFYVLHVPPDIMRGSCIIFHHSWPCLFIFIPLIVLLFSLPKYKYFEGGGDLGSSTLGT